MHGLLGVLGAGLVDGQEGGGFGADEAAPALGAQEQVKGAARFRRVVEDQVGAIEVVAEFAGQEKVGGQAPFGAFGPEFLIHHRGQHPGRDGLLGFILGLDAHVQRLASRIEAVIKRGQTP